jgi:colanic acid/amylovoran biosynthesis glycosyltransferase
MQGNIDPSMKHSSEVRRASTWAKEGPPRLAYLLSSYPDISHTFFLNEITELTKHGFDVDVASINRPGWEPQNLSEPVSDWISKTFYIKAGRTFHTCCLLLTILITCPLVVFRGINAVIRLGLREPVATFYSMFYLAEALILGDWLRSRGHTHLHVHFGGPVATVGLLASIAWRIPYSMTIHGPEEFYSVEKSHLRKKVEQARFVLCISDYCRSQLMKISQPVQWKKFHIVRLGVDVALFAPKQTFNSDDHLELVSVGRLVPDKGHLLLLQAFSRLVSQGYKLRLRIIGEGSERKNLENFIIDQHLADSVTLEGARNHEFTRGLLSDADIFVLASFAEGLPIALMEAMAMEVACVSTYIAGIPELIRPEVDGLLVPASSEEALVEALKRLILDRTFRQSLGYSGRRRVVDLYSLDTNVALLVETMIAQLGPKLAAGQSSPLNSMAAPIHVSQ